MSIKIITNHHWRSFIYYYELDDLEKKDLDWVEDDTELCFRYRGRVYALSEFTRLGSIWCLNYPTDFEGWHGYLSDSFFSGVLIRLGNDEGYTDEHYQVATYIS